MSEIREREWERSAQLWLGKSADDPLRITPFLPAGERDSSYPRRRALPHPDLTKLSLDASDAEYTLSLRPGGV